MSATAATANLSFAGLSVARGGRQVLRDVSITIPPGEVTALLGPNGAGKSTLVLTVGGVLRPTAGTVEENLRVATYALGRQDARSGIAHALELFPELEKRWRITARSLSGGEQQMVVLAQALVSRPQFVLVDELSLGLAPIVVQRLVPTIATVAASGVGVLLIEQFAHVALGLAQTAYVLERGRIHYHGTAQRLKDEPELLQSAYLLRDVDPGGDALETLS